MGRVRHHPLPRILPPSNEPGEPSTYFQHALGDQDPTPAKTDNMPEKLGVVGAGAEYPAASHAQSDPTGDEPPLGYAIDALAPVGESFEIAAAAEIAEGRSSLAEKPAYADVRSKTGILRQQAPKSLAEMTDADLEFCIAKAAREQMATFDGNKAEEFQAVIDSARAELDRRRQR